MPAVDWSDPCARAVALREAYFTKLSGKGEKVIRFRTGDEEQHVELHDVKIETLRQEMMAAEAECKTGSNAGALPRRFCFTAG